MLPIMGIQPEVGLATFTTEAVVRLSKTIIMGHRIDSTEKFDVCTAVP